MQISCLCALSLSPFSLVQNGCELGCQSVLPVVLNLGTWESPATRFTDFVLILAAVEAFAPAQRH